jgi:hypothetical protein
MENLRRSGVDDILIGNTQNPDGNRALGDGLGNEGAESSETAVLLNSYDPACLLGCLQNSLLVERLDPGKVENPCGNAFRKGVLFCALIPVQKYRHTAFVPKCTNQR